jgi:hypothetical protein
MPAAAAQDYPRISEGEDYAGLLDERKLTPHTYKISQSKLRQIIADAVKNANQPRRRADTGWALGRVASCQTWR